jgi:hypothetical protein
LRATGETKLSGFVYIQKPRDRAQLHAPDKDRAKLAGIEPSRGAFDRRLLSAYFYLQRRIAQLQADRKLRLLASVIIQRA